MQESSFPYDKERDGYIVNHNMWFEVGAMSLEEAGYDERTMYHREDDGTYRCRKCNAIKIYPVISVRTGEKRWRKIPCECLTEKERKAIEQEEAYRKAESERRRIDRISRAHIPAIYKDVSFSDFSLEGRSNDVQKAYYAVKDYVEHAEDHLNKGDGIYIAGNYGTGKTRLTSSAANELLAKGYTVRFVEFPVMFDAEAASWLSGEKSDTLALRNDFRNADFLFIDDFSHVTLLGKDGKIIEWREQLISSLIYERYNSGRPLIVTSNFPLAKVVEKTDVDMGMLRRINEMCPTQLRMFNHDSIQELRYGDMSWIDN